VWFWAAALTVAAVVVCVAVALSATPYALEDFDIYRRAAWDVRHGVSVYIAHAGELTYEYFPWFAVAMVPFTWIDPRVADVVWEVGICASVAASASLVATLTGASVSRRQFAVLAVAFLPLVWAEMVQGQVNAMTMAAALGGALAVSRNRQKRAAALFVVAALIKPHALIFLPWLWLRHRRVGITATTTLLTSLFVAGWLLPGATLADWGRRVWRDSLERVTEPPNVSLAMWATRLTHGRRDAMLVAAVLLALLAAAVVWFMWRRPAATRSSDAAEVALLALAIPLISPQGWYGQFIFALPAALVIGAHWPRLCARDRAVFTSSLALLSVCATVLATATDQFVIDNVSLAMTLGAPGLIWTLTVLGPRAKGRGQR
jgi:alpha-1,2-mannosyltransferase